MRPQYATVASATTSNPMMIDLYQQSPAVSIAVTLGGGSMTYSVQYTLDPVFDPTFPVYYGLPAACTWFTFTSMSALTADNSLSVAAPVVAVRLNVTAYTSGTARIALVQSGGYN